MGPQGLYLIAPPVTTTYAQADLGGGGLLEQARSPGISGDFSTEPLAPRRKSAAFSTTTITTTNTSDLIPLGTAAVLGHIQAPASKTTIHKPTHVNIPHPVASSQPEATRPAGRLGQDRSESERKRSLMSMGLGGYPGRGGPSRIASRRRWPFIEIDGKNCQCC